jgi:hypothetical protein
MLDDNFRWWKISLGHAQSFHANQFRCNGLHSTQSSLSFNGRATISVDDDEVGEIKKPASLSEGGLLSWIGNVSIAVF